MIVPLEKRLAHWQRTSLIIGGGSLTVWVVPAVFAHQPAFQAYWFAWIFWAGMGFGSLAVMLLQFLTRGAWSHAVQRPAEAAAMTLPLLALLLVPALFFLGDIFVWTKAGLLADAPHKRAYLEPAWFTVRSIGYFVALFPLALAARRWSTAEDRGIVSPLPATKLRDLGAGGLVAYVVCMMFASTDWVLSLEPQWYSTMFAVIFSIGQFLTALSGAIVLVAVLARTEPFSILLTTKHLHDLGNLLLTFVIFWTYVSFAQFLIIWSGNLPREISWYLHRRSGGWQYVPMALALFQFAVPFALLLSRAAKQHRRRLGPIAALVFVTNIGNVWWLVTPSFQPDGMRWPWREALAFVGIGGLWCSAFLAHLRRQPLVALRILEVAKHG
jgi:hypothetical protein